MRSAQRLMLRHGYSATTVEMICTATKLSKGVFFHYFDSKKDLAMETLRSFFESLGGRLQESLAIAPEDPLDRLQFLLGEMCSILNSPQGPRGCLIATFVVESAEAEPDLRRRCAQYFREWAELLRIPIEEAIARHAPGQDLDGERLSYYCIAVMEGSLVLARARHNPMVVEQNARLLAQQFGKLLGRA